MVEVFGLKIMDRGTVLWSKLQKCYATRQTLWEVIINKMVLTIIHLDGGHIVGVRVRNMHITTDGQGSSSYAGGYRYTDEHGKKFGSGVEITGVQVITGGHTVGLQQMVTHIAKDTEDNINSGINTKERKIKWQRKFLN